MYDKCSFQKKNVWQMYTDQNYDLIIKVTDYNLKNKINKIH